jgi:hypothetical protein
VVQKPLLAATKSIHLQVAVTLSLPLAELWTTLLLQAVVVAVVVMKAVVAVLVDI